jgi:hypothetical protein
MPGQSQKAGRAVGVTVSTPRPWSKPGAHGRIADGGGPGNASSGVCAVQRHGPQVGGTVCKTVGLVSQALQGSSLAAASVRVSARCSADTG